MGDPGPRTIPAGVGAHGLAADVHRERAVRLPRGTDDADPGADAPIRAKRRGRRTGALGGVSIAAAVVTVLIEASAIEIATRGRFEFATGLAVTSIATSVLAVLLGAIAAITGRGRSSGITGAVLGLVVNPLVLVVVLGALTHR